MKNRSEYGQICYKVGLACWYFADQWGKVEATEKWFPMMLDLPGELQKKSQSYLNLGKWRSQLSFYAVNPDTEGIFRKFYEEMKTIGSEEETYFQLAYYKEELLFFIHYLVELKEEGMEEKEILAALEEMKEYIGKVMEERKNILELKTEDQSLLKTLEESISHVYRGEKEGGSAEGDWS